MSSHSLCITRTIHGVTAINMCKQQHGKWLKEVHVVIQTSVTELHSNGRLEGNSITHTHTHKTGEGNEKAETATGLNGSKNRTRITCCMH